MNVKLVTLTAAALALLVGCTPGPDAPPPGVTPVPAASLPRVPGSAAVASPTLPVGAVVVPALPAYSCRTDIRKIDKIRASDETAGFKEPFGGPKFVAVDLGQGWSLVASYGLFDPVWIVTDGERYRGVAQGWDGIYSAYPAVLRGYADAERVLLDCLAAG